MSTEISQPPAPADPALSKEQLKKMAGAQNLQLDPKVQPGTQSGADNDIKPGHTKSKQNLLRPDELDLKQLRSVRPVSARAVPKALFTALLLSPIFLVAFVFVQGIKVPKNPPLVTANQSKAQAREPEDATDEMTELRRQLAQANAQLALSQRENEQALSAALPQPAVQKESKKVVRTMPTPTRVVARTVAPVPLVQPLRPVPTRVQPQMIVKSIPAPKTAEPVDPNAHWKQLASADIYGSAVLEHFLLQSEENTASFPKATTKAEITTDETARQNTMYYPNEQGTEIASSPEKTYSQSVQATQQSISAPASPAKTESLSTVPSHSDYSSAPTDIPKQGTVDLDRSVLAPQQNDFPLQPNLELEAPLLNGQPQHFLKGGTAALATLATPLILQQHEGKQENLTIVLSEPLLAVDRTEVFPVGTQIIAQLRSRSVDGIAKVVGVFALVQKGNAVEKIRLPDSAIQILTLEGEPLAVLDQPKEPRRRRRSLLGSVARRTASSTAIGSALGGNSSLISELAQEAANAAVSELEHSNDRPMSREKTANVQYLAAGTEVGVFVTLPFSVPAMTKVPKRISSQTNLEPQLGFVDDPSVRLSINLFRLRNGLRGQNSDSDN